MAKTSTVKSKHASKHATNGSGIRNSKVNDPKKRSSSENAGVSKKKAPKTGKGSIPLKGKAGNAPGGVVKKKRRIYTEKELGIPQLNMITPVGVEKPKGGKKGKVFVDDKVCGFSSLFLNLSRRFQTDNWIGEHDDNLINGACRKGWTNREQDDESSTNGGDSRG